MFRTEQGFGTKRTTLAQPALKALVRRTPQIGSFERLTIGEAAPTRSVVFHPDYVACEGATRDARTQSEKSHRHNSAPTIIAQLLHKTVLEPGNQNPKLPSITSTSNDLFLEAPAIAG